MSMLIDQKVPLSFWAEALATSVYLKNRSPTSFLNRQTPFEAWKGKNPDVGHLRVFGCDMNEGNLIQKRRNYVSGLW